jgi:hypothetical protein
MQKVVSSNLIGSMFRDLLTAIVGGSFFVAGGEARPHFVRRSFA